MAMVKEKMKEVIDSQPDDATYEEILRELAFERMVERGLMDSREGRVISDREMGAPFPLMAEIRWTIEAENMAEKYLQLYCPGRSQGGSQGCGRDI